MQCTRRIIVLLLLCISPLFFALSTGASFHTTFAKIHRREWCRSSGSVVRLLGASTPHDSSKKEEEEEDYRQDTASSSLKRLPLVITESDWKGAGLPRDDLRPEELPTLLMNALALNDFPQINSGLHSMWAFAGDTTRHIFQHNKTEFIESAHDTAKEFPTSLYGTAFYGQSWKMITPLSRVGGEDGWIATQICETVSSDGRLRRWQWEIRKNKRPPNLNCWFVESIGSSDRKGQFEAE